MISPLLANVFLHYVLDLWVHRWRRTAARGRVIVVRYCDDFVMGFQRAADAQSMLAALRARLGEFGLALHDDKTRLLEFGLLAAAERARRGLRRPETFAFLGFTHYGATTRRGGFVVKGRTQSKRMTAKLKELRDTARRRMHSHVGEQHRWLCSVLRGHYAYYGLPSNLACLATFYQEVRRLWFRTLRRRSQRSMTWSDFASLLTRLPLPVPRLIGN